MRRARSPDGAKAVDAYLAAQPAPMRVALERIRALVRAAAPGATEGISYRMPAFRTDGGVLICYAGFRDHGSVFPGALVRFPALARAMRPFAAATGTLRFTLDRPIPAMLIRQLVKARLAEQTDRRTGKKAAGGI